MLGYFTHTSDYVAELIDLFPFAYPVLCLFWLFYGLFSPHLDILLASLVCG